MKREFCLRRFLRKVEAGEGEHENELLCFNYYNEIIMIVETEEVSKIDLVQALRPLLADLSAHHLA